jgi:hypothetical protein
MQAAPLRLLLQTKNWRDRVDAVARILVTVRPSSPIYIACTATVMSKVSQVYAYTYVCNTAKRPVQISYCRCLCENVCVLTDVHVDMHVCVHMCGRRCACSMFVKIPVHHGDYVPWFLCYEAVRLAMERRIFSTYRYGTVVCVCLCMKEDSRLDK